MNVDEIFYQDANIESMACSVTLLFTEECHREAWLKRNGLFRGEYGVERKSDYERRRPNTNLMYMVGVEPLSKEDANCKSRVHVDP
ncbi:hypothetical protein LCGC14_2474250 [marine sediment metagenome]|uniref:Uncharacterized protein n=2 Tax=root TaxID=1 RepID=A0A0F9BA87_9ZZZZ|nr:MAG: hypothetical protein LCMAC202_03660 [Marseillevirus LCMAC202]